MMKKDDYVSASELAKWREDNKPPFCPVLGHEVFTPVVDHDHKTGRIRAVISLEGNALIGKIENFYRSRCVHAEYGLPHVLRCIADYLEEEQGPLHPIGTRQLTKRFSRASRTTQIQKLEELGVPLKEIYACKNAKQRTMLYRRTIVK
jgi:hypothetical protein